MRVLIADDEASLRDWLRRQLTALEPGIEIVAETGDGPATIEAIERLRPDVAFLDIRMPGATGLDVAARCASLCHVVFVTAYDEFALEAFDKAAVDYLVKPVRPERLSRALARLRPVSPPLPPKALAPDVLGQLLDALKPPASPAPPLRWLTCGSAEQVRLIDVLGVDYFAAQDKYTEVHTATETALVRLPLARIEEQLDPAQFWRIHRGYVVRVAAIRQVRRDLMGRLQVELHGHGERLPVSRACAHLFKVM